MSGSDHLWAYRTGKRPKPWQEFYTEETRDKVLQMYARDFKVFGYDTAIPKRPELGRPPIPVEDHACPSAHQIVAPATINYNAKSHVRLKMFMEKIFSIKIIPEIIPKIIV